MTTGAYDDISKADALVELKQANSDFTFRNFPEILRNDPEVALCAINLDHRDISFLGKKLRFDRKFILKVVVKERLAFEYIEQKFLDDENFMLDCNSMGQFSFPFASERLKNDKSFVLLFLANLLNDCESSIVKNDKTALLAKATPQELREDKDIMRAIYSKSLLAWFTISDPKEKLYSVETIKDFENSLLELPLEESYYLGQLKLSNHHLNKLNRLKSVGFKDKLRVELVAEHCLKRLSSSSFRKICNKYKESSLLFPEIQKESIQRIQFSSSSGNKNRSRKVAKSVIKM